MSDDRDKAGCPQCAQQLVCSVFVQQLQFARLWTRILAASNTVKQLQPSNTILAPTMAKARAVLFLSAIISFLLKEGLPFVVPPPSTSIRVSSKAVSSWAGWRGLPTTSAAGRPARISARRESQTTMSMADVCHGDFPTPGWVRLAQRNLARVSVGDQLPDSTVRYVMSVRSLQDTW